MQIQPLTHVGLDLVWLDLFFVWAVGFWVLGFARRVDEGIARGGGPQGP